MTHRIFKGPETDIGREIRAAALVYEDNGQAERAEGMRQAAGMVDELTARGVRLTLDPKSAKRADKNDWAAQIEQRLARVEKAVSWSRSAAAGLVQGSVRIPPPPIEPKAAPKPSLVKSARTNGRTGLSDCELAILLSLRRLGGRATANEVAFLSAYSPKSGSFVEAIRNLRDGDYVLVGAGGLDLREAGERVVANADPRLMPVPGITVLDRWIDKLDLQAAAILVVLARHTQDALSNVELAGLTDPPYSPTSGSFVESLRDLRRLQLVITEGPKRHRIAPSFARLMQWKE